MNYNPDLKEFANSLRNNMTDAEKKLWRYLKSENIKGKRFYRQKILNNYIVDFYCASSKLVIELDGGQHYKQESKQKDSKRDDYLRSVGLKVLRFSDLDVLKNMDGVLQRIYEIL
jgi:very-short-patch-repair endonuclease